MVGQPTLAEMPLQDIFNEAPPAIDFAAFHDALLVNPCEVKEAEALANQADYLVRRAQAETTPDLTLQVRPQY